MVGSAWQWIAAGRNLCGKNRTFRLAGLMEDPKQLGAERMLALGLLLASDLLAPTFPKR